MANPATLTFSEDLKQAFLPNYFTPVQFVESLLREAVITGASDIFLEPSHEYVRVRVRIDGVLYELGRLDPQSYEQVVGRIKVMGKLNSTEKRRVQEGQISIEVGERGVNLRLEVVQTIYGEVIVIRVHEKATIVMDLSQIGFSEEAFNNYHEILKLNHGLVLVCGPTGSGKSTTMYSTISYLNKDQNYNVMTIEDPVEFQLPGVNQMQTNATVGFTFAEGLRCILRLAPDYVFVGEIRDKETAEIAIESGLTGQLVFSTIHAQDAIGTLFRLLDIGIEPYFLNSSLQGILAQRLVRKVCQSCKFTYAPTQEELDLFKRTNNSIPTQLFKGKGCPDCRNIGYKGRTASFEVLQMSTKVRDLIRTRVSEEEFRKELAHVEGYVSLLKDGLTKCEQGITTVDEVWRNSLLTVLN